MKRQLLITLPENVPVPLAHAYIEAAIVELWLIAEKRIKDAREYQTQGDCRFEGECRKAGMNVKTVKDESVCNK